MSTSTPKTLGAHHVGLTVPDLETAEQFFIEALGFNKVGEVPDYPAVFVSDERIMITLWRAEDPATATPFDRRKNIGLHHLALGIEDADVAMQALDGRDDVSIEFPPEPLGDTDMRHLMVRIPGNIRLELIQS